ncbi:MAG: holo-ACP synthase [Verrucomicrobiae bacterium]|nr:holo-ACP synthase [Verrucomicrobiae bacterium]MCP5539561.1 holo-ACP synthase [Akkermansiaceae bacterium]MCP5550039.1 holo-ACP synthase [Akkermansiaceae bacterium]
MRIHGIGIDIVETARIADSIERFGERFLHRVYTDAERAYCDAMKHPARHYAARFAAKEAVSKTFGTGIGAEVNWNEIEILREGSGEPRVVLHGHGRETAARLGITRVFISLSHADHYAAANAVAVREETSAPEAPTRQG